MQYQIQTNYGALLHSSMSTMDNTTKYLGSRLVKGVGTSSYSGVPNS
jgi:hypothetical protein